MATPDFTIPKPQPLFPRSARADRPLFLVMMIMVFLACIAAMSAQRSYSAASEWGRGLSRSATVQLPAEQVEAALPILRAQSGVDQALAIDPEQSRELLRPWLGDAALPEDLPIPALIDLRLTGDNLFDAGAAGLALTKAGLEGSVDDHNRWGRDISRTARAVQILALMALALLMAGTVATAIFATQAGLVARREIIDVLTQIGARRRYIARLFTQRFGWLGLLSGISGAGLAGIMFLILALFTTQQGDGLLPRLALRQFDLWILFFAPLLSGLICAISAGRTVLTRLSMREGRRQI
ncbi:cell division protein FtsX [Robiginitomaculum antarcticum]|uniref:cell division protein FtsX n=1 Tax=Robiginitomaculum antarcticum TaxID=437507 RepID=UPI0003790F22|nr:hypothetical protein [Robiginitomaculum antarcticum]